MELVRQPKHDVLYDPLRGEILNIFSAASMEDRLREPTWLHANLKLTHQCNLVCTYCRTGSSPQVDTSGELSTQGWLDIFDRLKQEGVLSVFATGGEIFTRTDIWTLLEELERRFVVHILSNGYRLAAPLTEQQRRIIEGLTSVQISLDSATPELHDRFRGKGSWQKARSALSVVSELGVETVISTVVMPGQKEEVRALGAVASKLGVKLLLRPLLPVGRGKQFMGCQAIDIEELSADFGFKPYVRSFLAYPEELFPFGIREEEIPLCGVVAVGVTGDLKLHLDA